MPSKDQVVAETPASRAMMPPAPAKPARGAVDRKLSPLMKNAPMPMIRAKGRIFSAVMTVWNLPPPSTERRCTNMNTNTKATAMSFSARP